MTGLGNQGVGDHVFGLIAMVGVQTLVAKALGSPDLWLERTRSSGQRLVDEAVPKALSHVIDTGQGAKLSSRCCSWILCNIETYRPQNC